MIDAHQHFWRIARGDYGWLTPALAAIYRDFGPADLAPILARHGIDATILVQAAPTVAETRFLLDLAGETPFVAGVVGWAPFAAADAADRIARLAEEPKLVGLRPMVQDEADDDWLIRPALGPAFDAMIAHGLVFDALVLPRHLPRLLRVLERHPDLVVVVDHGAKPRIRDGALAPLGRRDGGRRGASAGHLQTVRSRYRSTGRGGTRDIAAVHRHARRAIRAGAAPLGQRLAGGRARRWL